MQTFMVHIDYHENQETIIVYALTFSPEGLSSSFCYKENI